jgi:hypothetical protein
MGAESTKSGTRLVRRGYIRLATVATGTSAITATDHAVPEHHG